MHVCGSALALALTASLQGPAETSPPQAAPPADPRSAPAAAPAAGTQPQATTRALTTYPGDPIRVSQLVLDNGLTVLLSENHERPEVFGAVVVRTGAKNDPDDNTGMAHYLEHMLFKGTHELGTVDWAQEKPLQEKLEGLYEDLGNAKTDDARARAQKAIGDTVRQTYAFTVPNELDRLLSEMGGYAVNAFTDYDQTVYHNRFPASQIEPWLELYAHRFQNPVFRLFPTELEAVYEEKNIAMDRFEYALYQRFMKRAFPAHPYGTHDILGEVEHLKRPSLKAMRAYFDRYYVANNMALVLSGDFDTESIVPVIERAFGSWRSGDVPPPPSEAVEPFRGEETFTVRLTPIRAGAYGFRTVPEKHPDYAALRVVRHLLTNEQKSGYLDRLVLDGKLLFVYPLPLDFADHNMDNYLFIPKIFGQSFKAAQKLVLGSVDRIARGEFSDADLAAARRELLKTEAMAWEDNRERALRMGRAFVNRGNWGNYVEFVQRLETVSGADVSRVAKTYFGQDRLLARSRLGFPKKSSLDKPHYPPVKPTRGATSPYYRRFHAKPQPEARVTPIDFERSVDTAPVQPGVVVHANNNPLNDIYSLELRFGVGHDAIRELHVLGPYLTRVGPKAQGSARFKQALTRFNTQLSFEATAERFVLRLEGPEQFLPDALALADALMRDPEADGKAWRGVRRELWGMERITRADPAQVARALRDYAFYGDNAPQVRGYGTRGRRNLRPKHLLRAWRAAQGHAVEIRYTGQQSAQAVAAAVRDQVTFGTDLAAAKQKVIHPRVLPAEPTVFFTHKSGAIQTHLWFGVDGGRIALDDRAAADGFDEYMGGGMAGLVFQEVREFRALAYSAGAAFRRDPRPSQEAYFQVYVGCQADKAGEALSLVTGMLGDLPRQPQRMEALRVSLARRQEARTPGARLLQAQIEYWRDRGNTQDPRPGLIPRYQTLELRDIEAIWKAHVANRPVSIMVVGDRRRVDLKALQQYGRLVKVSKGKLFAP